MNQYTKMLNRRFKAMGERSENIDLPVRTQRKHVSYSRKERYIQEHYFHYRADESTEILGKGRKIKPAEESLRWIASS